MGNIGGTLFMHGCYEPVCGAGFTSKPFRENQLTAATVTAILHEKDPSLLPESAQVKKVKRTMFGAGEGLMSVMYRLELDYGPNAEPTWPKTLVAKLGPPTAKARVIGEVLQLFETEVEWYLNDMPTASGIPAPKVYYAAHGGYGRYVLIMEDMAPAKPMDQFAGATVDQTVLAVKTLAKMHARYRGRVHEAEETKEWVRPCTDAGYAQLVRDAFHGGFSTLTNERYEVFGLEKSEVTGLHEVLAYIDDNYDLFNKDLMFNNRTANEHAQFVTTLCHGDFRAENIFPSAGADGGLRVIDYQIVREALGTDDLNYFMSGSISTEMRNKSELHMLQLYFDEMKRNGANDLTMEELLLSYQRGLTNGLLIFCIGQKDCNTTEQRAKDLIALMARRLEAFIADWQFLKAIKLRDSKQGDDGVTSKYSPAELRESLPAFTHGLL